MSKFDFSTANEPTAIAALLGLPRPASYTGLMLAELMKVGFPVKSAESVCRWIDPNGGQFGVTSLVPKATYHRRVKLDQPLSQDDSTKVWQVARVFSEAHRVYRDENAARAFLFRAHPLLESRRPIDLASESAAGAELVLETLHAAEAGVAV